MSLILSVRNHTVSSRWYKLRSDEKIRVEKEHVVSKVRSQYNLTYFLRTVHSVKCQKSRDRFKSSNRKCNLIYKNMFSIYKHLRLKCMISERILTLYFWVKFLLTYLEK